MVPLIPFEKGWEVTVNGKNKPFKKRTMHSPAFPSTKGKTTFSSHITRLISKKRLPSPSSVLRPESGTAGEEKAWLLNGAKL